MNMKLKLLLQSMGNPLLNSGKPINLIESNELLQLAFKNNIELEYLSKLKFYNCLDKLDSDYLKFTNRYSETSDCIIRIVKILDKNKIPYAITKTLRPYPATPNDSDILYLGALDNYKNTLKLLENDGLVRCGGSDMQAQFFDPEGGESFKRDKRGGRFYIDFYRELAADHVAYMDSNIIKNFVIFAKCKDTNINVFNPIAEIPILLLHSVIMHRTLPLEVFFTISYYLKSFNESDYDQLILSFRKNHLVYVAKYYFKIMAYIFTVYYNEIPEEVETILGKLGIKSDKINFNKYSYDNFPYIIELKVFFIALFEKTLDYNSLKGMFKQFGKMVISPRFFVEVLYHIFSKKRTIEHSEHV